MSTPRRAVGLVLAVGFALASCSQAPREIVIRVDTDATVPDRDAREPFPPNMVFDRVEIALFDDGASEPCAGCARTFGIDAAMFRDQQVSISVPLERGGQHVRARLFLAGAKGVPRVASTVESVVVLPRADERAEVLVELATASLGSPAGTLAAPLVAASDAHRGSRVGTWRGAGAPCAPDERPGTVCIPARWFWQRSAQERDGERLVVLSSFLVDAAEWSVARFRSNAGRETAPLFLASFPGPVCPAEAAGKRPAACVSAAEAQRLCAAQGGRLPTFHELSLLTGGLTGGLFPWGDDPATCADAVIARVQRGDMPFLCSAPEGGGARPGPIDAALPFGRDRIDLPTGTVLHLAGNLSEWAEATNAAACDDGASIRVDPRCPAAGTWTITGGSYLSVVPSGGVVDARQPAYPDVGLRCVYDR